MSFEHMKNMCFLYDKRYMIFLHAFHMLRYIYIICDTLEMDKNFIQYKPASNIDMFSIPWHV
jgi:hypothetical protein